MHQTIYPSIHPTTLPIPCFSLPSILLIHPIIPFNSISHPSTNPFIPLPYLSLLPLSIFSFILLFVYLFPHLSSMTLGSRATDDALDDPITDPVSPPMSSTLSASREWSSTFFGFFVL